AVIDAAQSAFLVAPEKQRDAAVRAEFVDQADAAVAVAEGDEVFAEEAHPHRRAVGLGDLARQAGGNPIPPHRIAHRRPGSDAGDQLVFLRWQHRRFLLLLSTSGAEPTTRARPLREIYSEPALLQQTRRLSALRSSAAPAVGPRPAAGSSTRRRRSAPSSPAR